MITEIFKVITDWYMAHVNYGTITALMAVESSFLPFPSEIVVPPAAWKAAHGELNIGFVFAASTAGALIGALFNYYFALIFGRKIIYKLAGTRWARLFLINTRSVEKAEAYFCKYGKSSTFIGRLVPAIRQLISLPAGLAKMNIRDFLLFTSLGSGLWNIILMALGYFLFTQKAILEQFYSLISYGCIGLAICFAGFLIVKVITGRTSSGISIKADTESA